MNWSGEAGSKVLGVTGEAAVGAGATAAGAVTLQVAPGGSDDGAVDTGGSGRGSGSSRDGGGVAPTAAE